MTTYRIDYMGDRTDGSDFEDHPDRDAAIRAVRAAIEGSGVEATISDDGKAFWKSDHYEVWAGRENWLGSHDTDHRDEAIRDAMAEHDANPERKTISVLDTVTGETIYAA